MSSAADPGVELHLPLRPPKDVSAELSIKALVGGRATPMFHVFELTHMLPRFAMYAPAEGTSLIPPSSGVSFVVRFEQVPSPFGDLSSRRVSSGAEMLLASDAHFSLVHHCGSCTSDPSACVRG